MLPGNTKQRFLIIFLKNPGLECDRFKPLVIYCHPVLLSQCIHLFLYI